MEMIRRIANREGEFCMVLGKGVRAASARHKGEEFALVLAGMKCRATILAPAPSSLIFPAPAIPIWIARATSQTKSFGRAGRDRR